ncbi:MAG: hypothetical protein JRN15_09620 [Nitrososphaerota archaeon]|nr:hypothetical protein [Nitrososphaerota archaeon]
MSQPISQSKNRHEDRYEEETNLDWEILECIDTALDVLGERTKFNIYWRLLIVENIDQKSIVYNPQIFVTVLEKMFGLGAKSIENEIIDKIRCTFGLPLEGDSLASAVRTIRSTVSK